MAPIPPPIQVPEPDAAAAGGGAPKTRVSARGRLRTYFLTGIIVAGPLAITAYITWWFIALIDSFVKPLVPASYLPDHYLPFSIPGLGLVIAFLAVTLLGFLTANPRRTLGDRVRRGAAGADSRDLRPLQGPAADLRDAVLGQRHLVPHGGARGVPREGHVVGGVPVRPGGSRGRGSAAGPGAPADDLVGVFLPCAPNPTTGFFFYLPRAEVVELAISVDDAAKLVMSAGVIQPEDPQGRLNAMAATLRTAQQAGGPVPRREPQDA